jgi:hypothetical protein
MIIKNWTSNAARLTLIAGLVSGSAFAQNSVVGEGRTPVGAGDATFIRNAAKQEALRDAVIKAIKDATALNADDSRFAPIVNEVAKQLRDVRVIEEVREGSDFVTRIDANVDRRLIKNAIRGTELDKLNDRSFSILMLVDEFVTSSRDLKLPLRELTEFSYDAGASYKDKTRAASASSSNSSSSLAATSSVNASTASSTRVAGSSAGAVAVQGRDGSAGAASSGSSFSGQSAGATSIRANESVAAAASAKSSKASTYQADVAAKSHEKASYRKLVEYQDASKPTSNTVFLSSFSGSLRDYDLRLLDSSITRSKFFGDRKITLATLSSSADMAKFAEFARKSNADFLMVGSSTVVAGDVNAVTGMQTCVVTAELKVFATAGSEQISSAAQSTEAAGRNIEDCAGKASAKIAAMLAPEFANRTLGYWADRAARGRQYTVEFKGPGLTFPLRMAFAKALREIPEATDVETKENSDVGLRATVTIKGKGSAMEQVFGAVSSQPAFAGRNLDGAEEGEKLTLCLNTCATPVVVPVSAPVSAPSSRGKK